MGVVGDYSGVELQERSPGGPRKQLIKTKERNWLQLVALQWVLLMRKNFFLTARGKKLFLFQVIAPILFMLVLYAVQSYVNDAVASTPESARILVPNAVPISTIPRCILGSNKGTGSTCISLMYAPINVVTTLLVSRVLEGTTIPDSEVMAFDTPDEMDDYILNHQNRTQAGYAFESWENGNFSYAIQFNNTVVCRNGITQACRYPSFEVAVPMQVAMDREIIRYQKELEGTYNAANFNYQWTTMQLPQPQKHYDAGVVPIFLLAAIMFNFVVLAKVMTYEKETKLLEGMRMMGLKELPYWASWFAHYTVIMTLCVFMLFVAGYIFSFPLFINNNFGVIFITLFLFSVSMICFAFFIVSLSSNSQVVATVGFILWVVFCAVFISINKNVYSNEKGASVPIQNVVSLISAFAFSKGIQDLNKAGIDGGITWAQRGDTSYSPNWPATQVWNFLILDSFIYLFLAWYISNVFPGVFGVPKPFHFFITKSYWLGSPNKRKRAKAKAKAEQAIEKVKVDDEDVHAEEKSIEEETFLPDTVVVLRNLVKIFGSGKKQFVAVKGVSLTMQNNQLFCLLGPNGAGKTTTFNMLTGLFPSSSGEADIFGYSIVDEMDKIRKLMGVCPQHDLLWDDLTGRQHLDFFCRFKNLPSEIVADEVEERLAEVGLTKIADVPTSAYSGGEKRRLSVALATVGDPKIVFLDEPTTGMDPVSRHQVWDIISKTKQGRVVVLTTHSMEEADRLSDRIGIVAHGQLRCLGSNIHLKHKFGLGYQLNMFYPPTEHTQIIQNIKQYVSEELPEWEECMKSANTLSPGCMTLSIPHEKGERITDLLRSLEDRQAKLGITEISMNLSSLEEVFLKIASESLSETSISLTDINEADYALDKMMSHSEDQKEGTPFTLQALALFHKLVASYKHGWRGLLAQFCICILLVLVMLAMGSPTVVKVPQNLHPAILPPPYTRLQPPPVLTIPFSSSTPLPNIGSCCQNKSGMLGFVDFSLQNSTQQGAYSLGKYFPTNAFTFAHYDQPIDMYQWLLDHNSERLTTAYLFNDLSADSLSVSVVRNLSEPYAVMGYVGLISNAYFRYAFNSNYTLKIGYKTFPTNAREQKDYQNGSAEATWVVLGCSFFMVSILSFVVREKQYRQRYLMKMSGMRMAAYWTVMFSGMLVVYLVLLLFFYGFCAAAQLPFFSSNSPAVLIPNYFVFAFNQIALAFLISSFSNNAHTIALAAYIYIVALVVATSYINPVFADESYYTSSSVLYGTAIIPQIAFGRVISIILYRFYPDRVALSFDQIDNMPHLKYMYVILFLTGVAFLILHQYFEKVIPTEFGKSLNPFFFLMPKFWRGVFSDKDYDDKDHLSTFPNEPPDVSAERSTAVASTNLPLSVTGITKIFKDENNVKVAVNNLAFSVGKAECFGVLGPNGGGKTTLVNLLCGLYPSTTGTAFIEEHRVDTHLELAQRHIGVCPQDSVLFGDLTGREHLLLFGRLRNLKGEALESAVDLALKQVLLTDAQDRQAGGYSGGMKRRLSLAIALVGNPKVVMLDEPTTGVDPFSRRVVWDVIQSYKKYTSIILITHSMEEAEALCDRVCMVSEGTMRCVGRPIELKARYGVGYSLTIMYQAGTSASENIIAFVRAIVPSGKVLQVVSNTIIFSLPKEAVKLSELFSAIQQSKEELNITDWGLLQSSLEDVLLQATGIIVEPIN